MTLDELDALLDHTHREAIAAGNPELEAGVISLSADSFIGLSDFRTRIPVAALGMFYRDVRVLVGTKREDGLLTRAEARIREGVEEFREPVSKVDWRT